MAENRPSRWTTAGLMIVPTVAGAAFFMLFDGIRDIRDEQAAIRKELATQTQTLHRVEDNQADFKITTDQRFATRSEEHTRIADKIDDIAKGTLLEVGRLKALHDERRPHP